jgi:hypothetical protein
MPGRFMASQGTQLGGEGLEPPQHQHAHIQARAAGTGEQPVMTTSCRFPAGCLQAVLVKSS